MKNKKIDASFNIDKLKSMLAEKDKTLSAAVASITSASLACFDWINIMAYDLGIMETNNLCRCSLTKKS